MNITAFRCPACGGPQKSAGAEKCQYCGVALIVGEVSRATYNSLKRGINPAVMRKLRVLFLGMECFETNRALASTMSYGPFQYLAASVPEDDSRRGRVELFIAWIASKQFSGGEFVFPAWISAMQELLLATDPGLAAALREVLQDMRDTE